MDSAREPARRRFSEQETPGGHECGEVTSALQKAIRRGDERWAMYWATELDLAGYTGYVWKRLRIIASEDVGLADSNVFVQVWTLNQAWLELKKASSNDKAQSRRLHLLHAVAILARAPKSRVLDHAFMVFCEGERPRIEVPDHALDKHTARGRKLGRGRGPLLRGGGPARERRRRRRSVRGRGPRDPLSPAALSRALPAHGAASSAALSTYGSKSLQSPKYSRAEEAPSTGAQAARSPRSAVGRARGR
jgi:hypothetical protein